MNLIVNAQLIGISGMEALNAKYGSWDLESSYAHVHDLYLLTASGSLT